MELKEIKETVVSLIGTPYKRNHTELHCLSYGFNCFTWGAYILSLANIYVGELPSEFKFLRYFRNNFIEVKNENPQPFDIPVFYFSEWDTRHVGIMLSDTEFTHCSVGTNGVAIGDLSRTPWTRLLDKVYRHK